MTLQQLKYALTIADCGSMNEAAKTLFLSQPSLSETIRELETEIGFDLFVRSNRGILVTPEGEEFLGICKTGHGAVYTAHFPLYRQAGQRKVQRIHAALYICSQGICGDGKTGWNGTV